MKKKDLHALFDEVSSRTAPVRGIYKSPSTEKERKIVADMESFLEDKLAKKEKAALESMFLSSLDQLDSEKSLMTWYEAVNKHYTPEQIPDTLYIRIMGIAQQKKFNTIQDMLTKHKTESI
jgi:hypothetical protein